MPDSSTLFPPPALRDVMHAFPAPLFTTDPDGHITFFNRAAADLWGRQPALGTDQWCGSWRIYRLDGTPVPLPQCPMAIALREKHSVPPEQIVIERPDGSRRTVVVCPNVILDGSGTILGGIKFLIDVTNSSPPEMPGASQKPLCAQPAPSSVLPFDDPKLRFLTLLSHDLRTPLTPVLITVASLESDPAVPEELRPLVAMIHRNIELEIRRIDHLLDLLRRATLARSSDPLHSSAALYLQLSPASGPAPTDRPRSVPARRVPSLRLLLVEDDVDTSAALDRLLRLLGYRVRTASTVCGALEILASEPFDIVLSDLGLPDASGYELMRNINGRYPLKAIAMSGYGMEEDIQKSRDAGFADHLVKPVSLAQLESAIQKLHPHESPA